MRTNKNERYQVTVVPCSSSVMRFAGSSYVLTEELKASKSGVPSVTHSNHGTCTCRSDYVRLLVSVLLSGGLGTCTCTCGLRVRVHAPCPVAVGMYTVSQPDCDIRPMVGVS